eukprot:scaffold3186_cov125-Isochrysis_galbana.AAC.9
MSISPPSTRSPSPRACLAPPRTLDEGSIPERHTPTPPAHRRLPCASARVPASLPMQIEHRRSSSAIARTSKQAAHAPLAQVPEPRQSHGGAGLWPCYAGVRRLALWPPPG